MAVGKRFLIIVAIITLLAITISLSVACDNQMDTSNNGNGNPSSEDVQPPASDEILSGDNSENNIDKPIVSTKKYSVVFHANGGKFADDSITYLQVVEENSLLTAPNSPTKQGYSFAGWVRNPNDLEVWRFAEDKATEDITLYAKWTEKTATVLSVEGASIEDNSIFMVVENETDYVSLATKVICSKDCVWRLYYDRLGLTEIPTKIAAQKTGELNNGNNVFYIVVTSADGTQVNTYELTIHRSYEIAINYVGVYGEVIQTVSKFSGNQYVVDYTPSLIGYTFNHWKDENGAKVTTITPYSSINLYADFNANNYTAILDVNGGIELPKNTYEVTYDGSYSFPTPERQGYTFLGWYDNSTQLTDSDGNNLSVWRYVSNKNIIAHWQANKFTVTLNSNNNDAGTLSGSGEYSYDANVTIIANSNKGYTWVGWYDSDDKLVTTNTSYSFKMGFDKSFTAKWSIDEKLLPFNFTSTATTLKITGLKDKTLTSIEIPSSVTSIGYQAFYGCSSLISIEIPSGVTSISQYAFRGCSSLTIYCEAGSKPSGWDSNWNVSNRPVVWNCVEHGEMENGIKWGLIKDGTITIARYNGEATEVIIPEKINGHSVTNICNQAFFGYSDLISIEIPSGVTGIGSYVFQSCSSLTSVTFGENSQLTSIGNQAFSGCSSLTSIEIPSGVTSIGQYAFSGCSSLTIYCEAKSKPSGWDSDWNYGDRPVVWGYKG